MSDGQPVNNLDTQTEQQKEIEKIEKIGVLSKEQLHFVASAVAAGFKSDLSENPTQWELDAFIKSFNEFIDNNIQESTNQTTLEGNQTAQNANFKSEGFSDETKKFYDKNGNLKSEEFPDGTKKLYLNDTLDGNLLRVILPDKTEKLYHEYGNLLYEKYPDGTEKSYRKNGQLKQEIFPDKTRRDYDENGNLALESKYFPNGDLKSKEFPDGTKKLYENGRLYSEKLQDGTKRSYYENGQLYSETSPDGTYRSYDENGNLEYKEFPDRTRKFYENGQLKQEIFPDKTRRDYDENGNLESEKFPDGTVKKYDENGKLQSEEFSDGTYRRYYENGQLSSETLPNGTYRSYYENGQLAGEKLPDETSKSYYKNGQLAGENFPDGTSREYHENGQLYREFFADRTFKTYDENGKLKSKTLSDVTEKQYPENSKQTFDSQNQTPDVSPATETPSIEQESLNDRREQILEQAPIYDSTKAYQDFGEILKDTTLTPEEQMWYLNGLIEEEKQQLAEKQNNILDKNQNDPLSAAKDIADKAGVQLMGAKAVNLPQDYMQNDGKISIVCDPNNMILSMEKNGHTRSVCASLGKDGKYSFQKIDENGNVSPMSNKEIRAFQNHVLKPTTKVAGSHHKAHDNHNANNISKLQALLRHNNISK